MAVHAFVAVIFVSNVCSVTHVRAILAAYRLTDVPSNLPVVVANKGNDVVCLLCCCLTFFPFNRD